MARSARCVTPAAGKLEDQQLSAGWSHIERRCAATGLRVRKPDRHAAARFAVEYDLRMDTLPGEDPRLPLGCRTDYYTGKPTRYAAQGWLSRAPPCAGAPRVPLACHKCWNWNPRTWRFMQEHCPEAKTLRALQDAYPVREDFRVPARVLPRRGAVDVRAIAEEEGG